MLDDFTTIELARDAYGVVFADERTLEIDAEATEELRRRAPREPTRDVVDGVLLRPARLLGEARLGRGERRVRDDVSDGPPRDLVGYGGDPPDPRWPGGKRVALSLVLNYEEGGENTPLDGDPASEAFLHEVVGAPPTIGRRNLNTESMFEFGSRVGFWRVHRLVTSLGMPLTVFAVGQALERNPAAARAMVDAGWEVASHGWRWIDYGEAAEDEEREHIQRSVEAIERVCGVRPVGWYTGRGSEATRRLVVEKGGFLYDSDAYSDELPYWVEVAGSPTS